MENKYVVLHALYEQNPWWVSGVVPEEFIKPIKTLETPFKRRDFFVLRNKLAEKEITAIVGPRQVGKTTILYQLIDSLIQERKIDPKRALYFSFDYPRLKAEINEVLDAYATSVLREPLQELRAPIYVFLDEVFKF